MRKDMDNPWQLEVHAYMTLLNKNLTFAMLQQFFSLPSPRYTSPMIPHMPQITLSSGRSAIASKQ